MKSFLHLRTITSWLWLRLPFSFCAALFLSAVYLFVHRTIHPQEVFGTLVNLVETSIEVNGKGTGEPIRGLRAGDFEITDNGQPVRPVMFESGMEHGKDPVVLWLVVGCSAVGADETRGDSLAHADSILRPTLAELKVEDAIAIARWCGGDESKVVVEPTQDRQKASVALDEVLHDKTTTQAGGGSVQGLRSLIQLMHANLPARSIEGPTAIVFLEPGEASAPRAEGEELAREILSHTAASINSIGAHAAGAPNADNIFLIPYLCHRTGGQAFPAEMDAGQALKGIMAGLHSAYLLAWVPQADQSWHEIKVSLTKAAAQSYGPTILTYRSGYSTKKNPGRYTVEEGTKEFLPCSRAEKTIDSLTAPFEAEGATYDADPQFACFTIKGNGDLLSWAAVRDGDSHSELTVTMSFDSSEGQSLNREVRQCYITRHQNDGWMRLNQPFIVTILTNVPTNTSRIRFTIGEDSTGRTQVIDLPMKKVLDAPKLRLVIR